MTPSTHESSATPVLPIARPRRSPAVKRGQAILIITAIANIPLVLWFVCSAVALSNADFAAVRSWLAAPVNTILMVLLIVSTFWHARLGLQVVIEDYVHGRLARIASLVALNLGAVALVVAGLVSVIKVSVGSS